MKYIVIVVNDLSIYPRHIIVDDIKIEYVAVGHQFHGRHFRGKRPTHVVDRTYYPALERIHGKDRVREWYDYFNEMTYQAIRSNGEGDL